jgi:hypothetical protein
MSDINVTFTNNYGESRHYGIADLGRDPNSPPRVFDGYLDANQTTDPIVIHSSGRIEYQRSDGPVQVVDNIHDGDNVKME